MAQVSNDTTIGEALFMNLDNYQSARKLECIGSWMIKTSQGESLSEAAMVHGIDADLLVEKINAFLNA